MLTSSERLKPQLPTLIYDGECEFCLRWVDRLKRWDRKGVVRLKPLQDPGAESLSGVGRADLEHAMHLVLPDGRAFAGAGAVRELLSYVPGGWLGRLIMAVPGVFPMAERCYAWVARRRYRLACGRGACNNVVAGGRREQ